MKLETGKVYSGFKLLEEKELKEVNSIGRLFLHEKSGARLFHLENDDDNKVFSITFRTPPENSTGLPHILEHSVLCGSRKFPVKEPFVELAKGSMNTFLNAMTFPDKTMYPIASKNEKDFYNLMDVYLDAVLYPNIYKYPEILMQEGWHYDLENKDGEMTYKGVVYNEMKGAFSAPESILFRKIQETLFPDTPYGVESGGDPDVIPQLSYEEFIAFHQKYYHPSNSYIFLYGNGNILEQLKFIDENYLKNFNRIEVNSQIPIQEKFDRVKETTIEYPISPEEDERDKTFFSLNFVTGMSTDPELYMAMEILQHILLGTPASPLKKAIIEAEIGKDVFGQFDNSIIQPVFSIIVKNTNLDKKDKFDRVVYDTLRKLVNDGIDKKLIEASINIKEFDLREGDTQSYPKGLIYNIKSMDSWLYDEHPAMHLLFEEPLKKVKAGLTENYFERLIDKYLLNNNHCSFLVLKPAKGIAEARAAEIKKELQDYKASLSESEIEKIIYQTKKLKERQTTPDSQEDLEKIPMISLEDIEHRAEKLPQEEMEEMNIKVLFHPMFTNKIAYFNLLFDTTVVDQELIPYITLLSDVLGKINTEKYDYSDLSNEINIHTGGIRFGIEAYEEKGDDSRYYPKFMIRSKALTDKFDKLVELIGEVVGHSRFDDKKRLKEIIQQTKSQLEMKIFDRGHIVAIKRLFSYYSQAGYYIELVSGLEYYKFISAIEKNFESRIEEVIFNLKKVSELVFNKQNLIISLTCDAEDYNRFKENLPVLIDNIGNRDLKHIEYKFDLSPKNEGLMTQAKVQYVAKGFNFIKLGYSYTGSLQVFRTIAAYDYLWNCIRVQGGAYGAFAGFGRNGNMYFASYRDPNLKETLNVYDEVVEYLKTFDVDDREMTKYIIGTMSRIDAPLTPSMKGELATENYIRKITQEDIQSERDEILNTKQKDIKALQDLVMELMKQNYYCVLGNEERIKQNKGIFGNIINVFE